jgi:hypothetical protein
MGPIKLSSFFDRVDITSKLSISVYTRTCLRWILDSFLVCLFLANHDLFDLTSSFISLNVEEVLQAQSTHIAFPSTSAEFGVDVITFMNWLSLL